MCNVCYKEFRGWCKSFTRMEVLLLLLEAFLLIVFIAFLTFLILHFLACATYYISTPNIMYKSLSPTDNEVPQTTAGTPLKTSESVGFTKIEKTTRPTLPPDVQCTWEPSHKTAAMARFYENGAAGVTSTVEREPSNGAYIQPISAPENSDGEEMEEGASAFLLALVKLDPTREITFGCSLTAVSRYWALTAASCIEAVEEVDSLDAFVMLEGYGAGGHTAHGVADVRVHPEYARVGQARDVAALRSDDALIIGDDFLMRLPTVFEHLQITIGERFTIFGYGKFRTPEESTSGRGVRAVPVFSLPAGACGDDVWAPRHLSRGAPTIPATGDIQTLCAGPLYARGVSCAYCAGTPLVRARVLLGVMADSARCGDACEPARYVSLAAVRPWVEDVISTIFV